MFSLTSNCSRPIKLFIYRCRYFSIANDNNNSALLVFSKMCCDNKKEGKQFKLNITQTNVFILLWNYIHSQPKTKLTILCFTCFFCWYYSGYFLFRTVHQESMPPLRQIPDSIKALSDQELADQLIAHNVTLGPILRKFSFVFCTLRNNSN